MDSRLVGIHKLILDETLKQLKETRIKLEKDTLCVFRNERRKGRLKGRITKEKISKLNLQIISVNDTNHTYVGVCKNGTFRPYFKKDIKTNKINLL